MLKIERYVVFKNFESCKEADEFAREHGLDVSDELSVFVKVFLIAAFIYGAVKVAGALL